MKQMKQVNVTLKVEDLDALRAALQQTVAVLEGLERILDDMLDEEEY